MTHTLAPAHPLPIHMPRTVGWLLDLRRRAYPARHRYKSSAYRARAVRRPRRLLEEAFGLRVPAHVQVAVHDATADLRFLVLPQRPEGTEAWSVERLKALVGRDAMLGTALCGA